MEKLTASVSPKERYKQAAKIRAIAGASGVGGGEEFMRLSMKNPGKLTAPEKEFLQTFGTQMDTAISTMTSSDSLGSQFVGGAFQETMSGSVYDAMVKAQSTAGLEGRATDADTVAALGKQTNQLQGMQNGMVEVKKVLEKIAAWGDDAGVKISGGIAIGLLAGVGTIITQMLAARAYQAAMMGGIGNAAGAATGALGKMARFAGAAGGVVAAGAVGYSVGTWLNTLPEQWGWDSLSTNIGDAIDRLKGTNDLVSGSGDTNEYINTRGGRIKNPNYDGVAAVNQKMKSIAAIQDVDERQQAHLKMMSETKSEHTKALAEQIKSNTEMMKEMNELMKKGMAASQAVAAVTKENTQATKENTATSKTSSRSALVRAPMSNRPAGTGSL
jgi:hypothetical protein